MRVETVDIGAKVVRGPDWDWGDQDKDSDYGIIKYDSLEGWVKVSWMKKEKVLDTASYRIGKRGLYDLCYYEEPNQIFKPKFFTSVKTILTGLMLFLTISTYAHHLNSKGWCVNGKAVFQTVQFDNSLNVEVQYRTNPSSPWLLGITFNTPTTGSTTRTFGLPQPNQNQTIQVRFRYRSNTSTNWGSWSSPQSSSNTLSSLCSVLPISYVSINAKWADKSTIQLDIKVGEVTGSNLLKIQIKGKSGIIYAPIFLQIDEQEGSDKTYKVIIKYEGTWIIQSKTIN